MKEDYCTMCPESILGVYIGDACKDHDFHYKAQDISRSQADKWFRVDLAKRAWFMPLFAWIIWLGVRLFGSSHYS